MMTQTLAAAALVSLAAITAAAADSPDVARPTPAPRADAPVRLAEGLLGHFWGHEEHGEHRGRHHRWRDDDDDDGDGDGGRERHSRGAASGPADPNPTNAPVPDNGVFTGKARPKVEVQ